MAGYVILRYNERYKTWDVVLLNDDGKEEDIYEVDTVSVDKRYLTKIDTFEPHGDA